MMATKPTIEGYEINYNRELGHGAYGYVFECKSTNPNEKCQDLCIKITEVFQDNGAANEATILQLLCDKAQNNPHLVKVMKVKLQKVKQQNGGDKKYMMVVMEKCQSDLKKEMEIKKAYSNEEAWDIFRQLLIGYKLLFDSNILHRDLKPENILTTVYQKSIYKIADFGVGKILKKNDFKMTKSGTPVYSAPEITSFNNDEKLENDLLSCQSKSQIDIYSLGIIMHQVYCGQLPFQQTVLGIQSFHNKLQKQEFKMENQGKDQQLANYIEKMIVYLPSKRITFSELYQKIFANTIEGKGQAKFQSVISSASTSSNPNASFIPGFVPGTQRLQHNVNNQFPRQKSSETATPQISLSPQQTFPLQAPPNQPQNRIQTCVSKQQFNQQLQNCQPQFGKKSSPITLPNNSKETLSLLVTNLMEQLNFLLIRRNTNRLIAEFFLDQLSKVISELTQFLTQQMYERPKVKNILSSLKPFFTYSKNLQYCQSYIDFLFNFTYLADLKEIEVDLLQMTIPQKKDYLDKWTVE